MSLATLLANRSSALLRFEINVYGSLGVSKLTFCLKVLAHNLFLLLDSYSSYLIFAFKDSRVASPTAEIPALFSLSVTSIESQ